MDDVERLIKEGANVNARDRGWTPLSLAANNSTWLITLNSFMSVLFFKFKFPFFFYYFAINIYPDHVKIANVLINNGADVEPTDNTGLSPLRQAATSGNRITFFSTKKLFFLLTFAHQQFENYF